MRHTLASLTKVSVCAILALGAVTLTQAEDKKADPSGTWTWTTPGRNGGPDRKSTLTLKLDGEKVTGKLATPGRGGQARETDIEEGKMNGDQISFSITREFNGNKFTSKYSGKISGDTITGKVEVQREGQDPRTRDWEAKRGGDKKEDDKK